MLQKRSFIVLPLVAAIAFVLFVGLFLMGRKRMSKPDPAGVVRHSLKTPAEDVQKYWTAEKMREAKPVPMPYVSDVKEGKKRRQRPAKPQESQNPEKPQA